MDSMVTSLVDGTTLTRIIDWVRTWSELKFESSSEPSNNTVNAPVTGDAVGNDDADGVGENSRLGEGVTLITWLVALIAISAAGMKYARPPASPDITRASRRRKLVR